MNMELTGNVYVVAAPSGAGKTSLVKALIEGDSHLGVAVSHTTRPRRSYEHDRINYHFVEEKQFLLMLEQGKFLEHASVFNHHYGTSWEAIEKVRAAGKHIILEIDWQGAEQIRKALSDCISIFILPPSLNALKSRLENRGQDDQSVIDQRMNAAINELSHFNDFDYLVVNDNFDTTLSELRTIIRGDGKPFSCSIQKEKLQGLLNELLQSSPIIV